MGTTVTDRPVGHRDEELSPRVTQPVTTWWERYRDVLNRSISPTSLEVVEADSAFIVERCLPPAGSAAWGERRVRKGLVMGAVQSGKTASMIAVAAQAMDAGVDMVVVLSGTRTALWRQSFDRLKAQLDGGRSADRVWIPQQLGDKKDSGGVTHYNLKGPAVRRAVREARPIIAVAMKQTDHLAALSSEIHQAVLPCVERAARPFHLLVIDDEADDASITDARSEVPSDPKQVPRRIVDLWDGRPPSGATASPHLYATYMAYTATPQANLLQDDDNPLAPRDFVVSLRTAGPEGSLGRREPTYTEPAGIKGYYTGGDLFYERLPGLCVEIDAGAAMDGGDDTAAGTRHEGYEPADEYPALSGLKTELESGLKAFLVGCAVRYMREPDGVLSPAEALKTDFPTEEGVTAQTMGPSSMLVHPSAVMDDHFQTALEILGWASGRGVDAEQQLFTPGERRTLGVEGVWRSMDEDPDSWHEWLTSYQVTSRDLAVMTGSPQRAVPAAAEWPEVRDVILNDILPATLLAVINSDEMADDRPSFRPEGTNGGWRAPRDAVTIFVSGSVMARGLTLEGLLTTVFTRRSGTPSADTQMQMQRWFGYRGEFLDLCRVFLFREQRELFRRFHDADLALRKQILGLMEEDGPPDVPTVLQSFSYVATSKVSNVRTVPLAPRAHPFFPRVQDVGSESEFTDRLLRLFSAEDDLVVSGPSPNAVFSRHDLTLDDAAELLESMRFDEYVPGRRSPSATRWKGVERLLGARPHAMPLYRPPGEGGGDPTETACPYWTAAHLRLWSECLNAPTTGLYRKPDGARWNLLDVDELRSAAPTFRVGLRVVPGGGRLSVGPLADVPTDLRLGRRTVRDGRVSGGWGSQNPSDEGATGDKYLDLIVLGEDLPSRAEGGSPPRPSGAHGLLLFHLVHGADGPGVVLGASIPEGGPEQLAAQVRERHVITEDQA